MYGKVYSQLFDGTLHGKLEASAVFMAMIAIADIDGTVDLTLTALTSRTGWPSDFVERGIRELEMVDLGSRTPDEDGRRIVRLRDNTEWGWKITNYAKYRGIRDENSRREYMREYMRKRRGKQGVNPVSDGKPQLAHAEVDDKKEESPPSDPPVNTNNGKKPPRKSNASRKHPIPDDFTADADLTAYVAKHLPGVDVPAFVESFIGKAKAKGWQYVNWRQAFQDFVRSAAPNSGHWSAGQYPKQHGAGTWQ